MLLELQSGIIANRAKASEGEPETVNPTINITQRMKGVKPSDSGGGDIYIILHGPTRTMPGVQRPTGACWTCDELGHYTKNCQRPQGNSDTQRGWPASATWS